VQGGRASALQGLVLVILVTHYYDSHLYLVPELISISPLWHLLPLYSSFHALVKLVDPQVLSSTIDSHKQVEHRFNIYSKDHALSQDSNLYPVIHLAQYLRT